jgi:hypothetical protein
MHVIDKINAGISQSAIKFAVQVKKTMEIEYGEFIPKRYHKVG